MKVKAMLAFILAFRSTDSRNMRPRLKQKDCLIVYGDWSQAVVNCREPCYNEVFTQTIHECLNNLLALARHMIIINEATGQVMVGNALNG